MVKILPNRSIKRVIKVQEWDVESESEAGKTHTVIRTVDEYGNVRWRCNCLWGSIHRDNKPHPCKHIEFIKRYGAY